MHQNMNLEALKVEMDKTSHPIVPLLRAMESLVSENERDKIALHAEREYVSRLQ